MAGTLKRIAGPAYISNAVANIYSPASADVYTVINQIHIANVTAGPVTFTLYIGGTGGSTGGTEIAKQKTVAANDVYDGFFSPGIKMVNTDFLTGVASAASSLTIVVMGSLQAT